MITAERLRRMDPGSAALAVAGAALPLLLVLQPLQPVRALAGLAVILVLPGLAAVRFLGLRDTTLALITVPAVSLAATVIVATGLTYVHAWSWQLTVVLLGAATVLAALATQPASGGEVSP